MPIKFWMSSILGQIEFEHPKLFALEFGKIADSDFVYTLASTNIDQSTPNLIKMYMTIRLRMSLIRIRSDQNFMSYLPLNSKIYIYNHKVSDEFDYGTNRTRTSKVICP